jgi:hypothetical protein
MKNETKRESGRIIFRRAFPEARSLWEAKIPHVGVIEAFWLGKTFVLVQEYANGDGWQVFTPTTDEGWIDLTIQAIAERTGVAAERVV